MIQKQQLLHRNHKIEEKDLALMFHLAEDLIDPLNRKDDIRIYFRAESPGWRSSVEMVVMLAMRARNSPMGMDKQRKV